MAMRALALVAALAVGQWLGPFSASQIEAQSDSSAPGRGSWVPSLQILYGGYEQVNDMAVAGLGEAWGISTSDIGTVSRPWPQTAFFHWVEGSAAAVQILDNVTLSAISMSGSGFGLAVGRYGHAYRYDGERWRPTRSPVPHDLTDVALLAPDDGWVVGNRGTILRWDGERLKEEVSPVEIGNIVAIDMVTPDQGWAVMKDGRILKYDGVWSLEDAPEIRELADVAFEDSDHGLAVGQGVLERVGGVWRTVQSEPRWTVSVAWDGDRAYAATTDGLSMYSNGTWSPVSFDPEPVDVANRTFRRVFDAHEGAWAATAGGTTIWLSDGVGRYVWPSVSTVLDIDTFPGRRGDGWAGGSVIVHGFMSPSHGIWRSSVALPSEARVSDVALVGEGDGWAIVGTGLWRLTEEGWSEWPSDKLWYPQRLDMLSSDEGWLVGSGIVARWDGTEWQTVPDTPSEELTGALSMLQGGDSPIGWFGAEDAVYKLQDGEWKWHSLTGGGVVHTIDMPAMNSGWAATSHSLHKFDGQDWALAPLPVSGANSILGLDAVSADELWVLTDPGGLLHWTSADGWEAHSLYSLAHRGQPQSLRAEPFSDESGRGTDVWLAGDGPIIARYRVVAPEMQLYVPVIYRE